MTLSVVIPTRNEEANIGACIDAFATVRSDLEIIVVDNFSGDRTRDIAAGKLVNVLLQGPERCAQRNRGWRAATGGYVMFVDADMIVPEATVREILCRCRAHDADCWYVREVRSGGGLRVRARNFERSFYDGTCIDALRVVRRDLLEKTGGYDENLIACEDWDLDRRLLAAGAKTAVTDGFLLHNEARQSLAKLLKKKAYYSASVAAYRGKWKDDETCRRQFGLAYRFFGVFTERGKWRRLLRHPLLAAVMYFERFAVGATYLAHRRGKPA
ncbi:MAG: glycosyltransferase [Kiritimatiellae bacterium]|nr:glycosyltransferase [Kiritimatiellia bacterium]